MLKMVENEHISFKFEIQNVSWRDRSSHLHYSFDEPSNIIYYRFNSIFIYLRDDIQGFFEFYQSSPSIYWDDQKERWFIEIFDRNIALMFKLTFG